jgi:hypothetical protein
MSARRSNRNTAPAQVDETVNPEVEAPTTEVAPATEENPTTEGEATEAPATEGEAPAAEEAEKAPKKRAGQKINWTMLDDQRDENGDCEALGERNGNNYAINRNEDGSFNATHQLGDDGPVTTLAENVSGKVAWRKCVDHHNANYIAPAVEEATDEEATSEGDQAGSETPELEGATA